MGLEEFRAVGEIDPKVEVARRAEIDEILERARERTVGRAGREIVTKAFSGDPVPYSGNERRTVVDVHLPPMNHPQDRANLPA